MRDDSGKKMLLALLVTAFFSALALGFVHRVTADKIKENNEAMIGEAVYRVLPGIDSYEEVQRDPLIFRGLTGGRLRGYAVYSDGMGFQGTIGLMAGFSPEVKITGVSIIESVETPGLGDRVREDSFLSQFRGASVHSLTDGFSAVTGATVSSEAVLNILRRALKDAEDIL